MNRNEKFTATVGILLFSLIVILAAGFWGIQHEVESLRELYKGHEHGKRVEEITSLENRAGALEEATNLDDFFQGYQSQISFYDNRIRELIERINDLEAPMEFPYMDQVGEDAPMIDDCGSAVVMMVAEYYGVGKDISVEKHHRDMAGGDYPVTFAVLRDYLESEYHLKVQVVTNNKYTIPALKERGYDVSEIEFITTDDIEELQNRGPMIWVYAREAHWVVRYRGWNFDPLHGIWPFQATAAQRRIIDPELGLGIIVLDQ